MTLTSEKYNATIVQEPHRRRPKWSESETPYGHKIDITLSAMIKEMRRGKEIEAMYWAHQLAISGSRAEKFMWESLMIFAVEDIGPANPQALSVVISSKEAYDQFEHGYDAKYLFVANVVSNLSLSKKTRRVENLFALMLYRLRAGEEGPEVPDYAIDFHLKSGKAIGRDLKHYYDEASKLVNEDESFRVSIDELRKLSE
jgi:replication-associated recombination protein RarA